MAAKIEAFHYACFEPKRAFQQGIAPLYLSLASAFEEPDLEYLPSESGNKEIQTNNNIPSPIECFTNLDLEQLRKSKELKESESAAFVLATFKRGKRQDYALYCRYPLERLPDLALFDLDQREDQDPDLDHENQEAYKTFLAKHQKLFLDPLVLAVSGLKSDAFQKFQEHGELIYESFHLADVEIELRAILDEKSQRALIKLFQGGLLSPAPEVILMDGPFKLTWERYKAGQSHAFACLIPVGESYTQLCIHELLFEAQEKALEKNQEKQDQEPLEQAKTSENTIKKAILEAKKASSPSSDLSIAMLDIPEHLKVQRYYYSSPGSREAAAEDWEEDLRLEAAVRETCALLLRDNKEFDLLVHREAKSGGLDKLFLGSFLPFPAKRLLLEQGRRASKEFLAGRGLVALWVPRKSQEHMVQDIVKRRPLLSARRAMLKLEIPLPLGLLWEKKV